MSPASQYDDDPRCSPIGFAELCLGMRLYAWQDRVLSWFELAGVKRVKGTLCTPNGAGKSGIVIAAVVLWWLGMHKRGKVVVTTKDGKQLDNQILPAIYKHRSKFQGWRFLDRLIETPTGGRAVFFTTDEPGRAEGWHRDLPDEPLLIIIDEAKSVDETIFEAVDRCTYDAVLYTSSPGKMTGRFYESHLPEANFLQCKVGLADCPHIPQERVQDILATYGPDHPFTKSTLYGEFMEAEGEMMFNYEGVQRLKRLAAQGHGKAELGMLVAQNERDVPVWVPGADGAWLWLMRKPEAGRRYIGWGDPMTGEQSEGSKERDTHAFGILAAPFPHDGTLSDPEVVAVLHHPAGAEGGESGVRWDNDILVERFDLLLRYFGDCLAIVEANNAGTEVLRLLKQKRRKLWRRERRDDAHDGKKLEIVGFQTTAATKSLWIGALGTAIREQTLDCCYAPAASQCATFIMNEKGGGEAQQGSKDDFVAGLGLGLFALPSATVYVPPPVHGVVVRRVERTGGWG